MKLFFLRQTIVALLLTASISLSAQGLGALRTDSLPLIPYPRHITVGTKDFTAEQAVRINVFGNCEDDLFAVSTLTEEWPSTTWKVRKGGKLVRQGITVSHPGENRQADKLLREAGLELTPDNKEAYLLLVDDEHVVVEAATAAGIYYAVQTLRQLAYTDAQGRLAFRAVRVSDAPSLRYRWIQDDWNRGPIPNIEFVKKQIRTLSEYKLNGYCIYAENIFESQKYPQINMRGAVITPAEVKELVAYGKRYHVDIIPQQECLGHMHYTLREGGFDDIAERPRGQIVSPAVERTYTFLNDYLGELLPAFDSPFVHVGCDEAFELGKGKSRQMVEELGRDGTFFRHMQRIASLPALHDKKILFWGDVAENKANIDLSPLPKNTIAVVWDYLARGNYEYYLPQFKRNGIPTFVAPGAFWGGRVFPEYDAHLVNIQHLVRDGKKYGTLGMMCCTWDDMGEDIFDVGWYGILYSAACAWQHEEETPIAPFKRSFDWAFYRNNTGTQIGDAIDSVSHVQTTLGTSIWYDWAYTLPFEDTGVGQQNLIQNSGKLERIRTTLAKAYGRLQQVKPLAKLHRSTYDAVLFDARRLEFVFTKAALAAGISQRYDDFLSGKDDEGSAVNTAVYDLVMPQAGLIGSLRDFTMELKDWHHELWLKENRPYHWDIVEARYNHALQVWNEQDARLRQAFGTRPPREDIGIKFERYPKE